MDGPPIPSTARWAIPLPVDATSDSGGFSAAGAGTGSFCERLSGAYPAGLKATTTIKIKSVATPPRIKSEVRLIAGRIVLLSLLSSWGEVSGDLCSNCDLRCSAESRIGCGRKAFSFGGSAFVGCPSISVTCLISCSNSELGEPACQFVRFAACSRRNSKGIFTSSMKTGSSTCRRAPSAASVFTQSDAIDALVQTTTTHRAASNSCSMTWSKLFPKGIFRSHQTDQPCCWIASANALAFGRSGLE